MSSSKSSKGTTSQKKEDRELHETFCNGSPGCPFPECAEGTVLEEEDRDAI